MEEVTLFTFTNSLNNLIDFSKFYDLENYLVPPNQAIRNLKNRSLRICRFCKKKIPDTTFRKDSHIIPELLGNKYLISDFECDNCNNIFSAYENDLANWLGMVRIVLGTKGKIKTPKYKSAKHEIETNTINLNDQKLLMVSKKTGDAAITTDLSTGKTTLKYTKQAYIPIKVYKSILKIALSIVSDTEINQYDLTTEFLVQQTRDDCFDKFAKVICHQLPLIQFCAHKPIIFLFRKKDDFIKIPKHVFILYYANYIYSFPLPFYKNDMKNGCYNGRYENPLSIDVIYPPPLLFNKPTKDMTCISYYIDFSSYDTKTDDDETLEFEASENALKNINNKKID